MLREKQIASSLLVNFPCALKALKPPKLSIECTLCYWLHFTKLQFPHPLFQGKVDSCILVKFNKLQQFAKVNLPLHLPKTFGEERDTETNLVPIVAW